MTVFVVDRGLFGLRRLLFIFAISAMYVVFGTGLWADEASEPSNAHGHINFSVVARCGGSLGHGNIWAAENTHPSENIAIIIRTRYVGTIRPASEKRRVLRPYARIIAGCTHSINNQLMFGFDLVSAEFVE